MSTRSPTLMLLVILAWLPIANGQSEEVFDSMRAEYPGLHVLVGDGVVMLSGVPMGSGRSAQVAADQWLEDYGPALGSGELVQHQSFLVRYGKFTVFHYRQQLAGNIVEGSRARLLVREPRDPDDPLAVWRVVHVAAAGITEAPTDGFAPVQIPADSVANRVQQHPKYADLDLWMDPTLVILPPQVSGDIARRAWKVAGASSVRADARSFTFFVDAADGTLMHVRNEVFHSDVEGVLSGFRTPGMEPDTDDNPPEEEPVPAAEVSSSEGEEANADENGEFVLADLDEVSQTIEAKLLGPYVEVLSGAGDEEILSETATPPAVVDFVFNEDEEEYETAQVNAYVHTHGTHEFFRSRTDFDDIDSVLECKVNLRGPACRAWYQTTPQSINFVPAGTNDDDTCPNSAYSSVIAHEYGHFIVARLELTQGAFGEGFGDTMSTLQFDDPALGRGFRGEGTIARDIAEANKQFPCSTSQEGVHACGQVLAGIWWDLRLNFGESLGDEDGLDEVRQLFVDWAVTTVGQGVAAASVDTHNITEVLVLDDDDGNLDNGTPRSDDICAAFAAHNLDCPGFDAIGFEFPEGIPYSVVLGEDTAFPVTVIELGATHEAETGRIYTSVNGGAFTEVEMTATGDYEYVAEFSDEYDCGDVVEYYLSVEDADGEVHRFPTDAALGVVLRAVAGEAALVRVWDAFESDDGWTVGDADDPDDAESGAWVRVDPLGTVSFRGRQAQPDDDHTPGAGTQCFVTGQGTEGGLLGEADVDEGKTTLLSPRLNLSGPGFFTISYWRWYANDAGRAPHEDVLTVDISDDDGVTWVNVETVGPAGPTTEGGWISHSFEVADFISASEEARVRFVASDEGEGSIIEAAIDDFRVVRYACEETDEFLRGDCNESGDIDLADAMFLLGYLFRSDLVPGCEDGCDANDDGLLDLADAIRLLEVLYLDADALEPFPDCGADTTDDELSCFFTGCP